MRLAALLEAAKVEAKAMIHCADGNLSLNAYAMRTFNDKIESWYISLFENSMLVNEFMLDREFTVEQVRKFVRDFSSKLAKLNVSEAKDTFKELAELNTEDPDSLDAFVKRFLR